MFLQLFCVCIYQKYYEYLFIIKLKILLMIFCFNLIKLNRVRNLFVKGPLLIINW